MSSPTTNPLAPGRTVLIVDDEPVIRMIARAGLATAGYAATEVGDADEATAAVRNAARPFDLILLDLTLPGGDGANLIPVFRDLAPTSRILVVSGLTREDVPHVAADGFLCKPFTRAALLAAAEKTVAGGT